MANVRGATFFILTLIQWCHSEIVSTVPESWYSANVIKDGSFSPKPISELFSTNVDTFSTINPIVVLQTSRSPPPSLIPSSFQTSLDGSSPFTGSTLPASLITRDPTTFQTFSTTALPPIPPSISTFSPFTPTIAPTTFITPPPSPQSIQTVQTFAPTNPPVPNNIQYIICPTCPQPTQSSPIVPVSSTPSPLPIVTSSPFPTQSTFTRTASSVPCVTSSPIQNSTLRQGFPFIRIRMYTSRGSSPVFVNGTPRSTTVRTTTTRRPKRNRKNNYDACVNACGGGRNPICTAPLATRPVDPNALRGFPSICHMACYNSFKRIQYEKLADGRCGRLRTRIRPLDSRDKIRRDELNKNQYQVVSGDTVIDIAPLQNKK